MSSVYASQHRGSQSDYDRHLSSMDNTMQQKLAFTAAHFMLHPGAVIADMGCGSGLGSYQFALLNPHVQVVGIDIDPEVVRIAQGRHQLPNLRFEIGDIEAPDPALGPFDGILNSSVQHHVSSFNGYDGNRVANSLRNQLALMNAGGINVIRDFSAWPDDEFVWLDLSVKARGPGKKTPVTMSDADLLVLFSETAQPLTPERGTGFFLEEISGAAKGSQRFRLSAKWAKEFISRKEYRQTWDVEVKEVYGFWTPRDYRRELNALNARVLYTAPFWNPWIVDNWYRNQLSLWREDGTKLNFPPTNFIAVAEKVDPGSSLYVGERSVVRGAKKYLILQAFRSRTTGEHYDMAERPGDVVDCLPYMEVEGRLFVYAQHGYPRPLANTVPRGTPVLDDKHWSGHMVEPIAVAGAGDQLLPRLAERAGLGMEHFSNMRPGLTYFPSPGLVNEKVNSVFVPLDPKNIDVTQWHERKLDPAISGFSTGGEVRLYAAQDLLRAAQVGMLPGARLELNIYALMRDLGIKPDKWLLSELKPPTDMAGEIRGLPELLAEAARTDFEPSTRSAGYLKHFRSAFADMSRDRQLALREHEFVLPVKASANVASVLPLALAPDGEICVGLERRDLPAPQLGDGNSSIYVLPAYRLPIAVTSTEDAADYIAKKTGLARERVSGLGEGYFSSVGLTPERIFPFAANIDPAMAPESFDYVPLRDIFAHTETLRDGHLLIASLRAIHMLDLWQDYAATSRPRPGVSPAVAGPGAAQL